MRTDTIFARRAIAPLGALYKDCLVAADDESAERIAKVPLAEVAEILVVRRRSLPQMRLYRAAVAKIAEGIGESPDRLHNWTKLRLGFYETMEWKRGSGKIVPVLESTAFDRMSQDRFQQYLDRAIELWFAEILPGVDRAGFLAEIEAMLGEKLPGARDSQEDATND